MLFITKIVRMFLGATGMNEINALTTSHPSLWGCPLSLEHYLNPVMLVFIG